MINELKQLVKEIDEQVPNLRVTVHYNTSPIEEAIEKLKERSGAEEYEHWSDWVVLDNVKDIVNLSLNTTIKPHSLTLDYGEHPDSWVGILPSERLYEWEPPIPAMTENNLKVRKVLKRRGYRRARKGERF